jgi:hypothetical protein
VDVAFLAIRAAQQAVRDLPASASAAKFRDEWHVSNLLVRQAFPGWLTNALRTSTEASNGCLVSVDFIDFN